MTPARINKVSLVGDCVREPAISIGAGVGRLTREVGAVVCFVLLLAVSAQIKLYPPGSVVPVTMQTVAVLLCGFCLRPSLAVTATVSYLAIGLGAFKVVPALSFFAALHVGATFGYLLGFVVAAGVVSYLSRALPKLTAGGTLAVATLGTALIFLAGVLWLALLTGDLSTAVAQGLVPFVGWAAVKIALTAALVQGGRGWIIPRR